MHSTNINKNNTISTTNNLSNTIVDTNNMCPSNSGNANDNEIIGGEVGEVVVNNDEETISYLNQTQKQK